MSALALKKQELARRVENLPAEISAWKTATLAEVDQNAHFSQLQALSVLMARLTDPQRAAVTALDPAAGEAAFQQAALQLTLNVAKAQGVWDFFREKLQLRYSPAHREPLWVADTIVWDCYRPTMDRAVELLIVDESQVREPPLVYCTAEYSPATWVRESRPNDGRDYALGEAQLPIAVIELPWDHLDNAWEYLSMHHEVGHDIEADLKLRVPLQAALQSALLAAGTFPPRIPVWVKWLGEVFADLCAIRLAGPAFTDALVHLLLLPRASVAVYAPRDPHPTPYIRILLNAAYIRTLGPSPAIQDHATAIETEWRALYGPSSGSAGLDSYADDFPVVIKALMQTPLAALKDHSVEEVLPFSEIEDAGIRSAADYFRTGTARPGTLRIRHAPSAARLAIAAESAAGTLTAAAAEAIHTRVLQYVRQRAPGGLRGGGTKKHEEFVAGFAERILL